MVWYSHLFKKFPQFLVIHTVKGFGIVNKAEIDVFLELSCFFHDPMNVGNLISGSSAFSKTSLNIWKFTAHVLLKPDLGIIYLIIPPQKPLEKGGFSIPAASAEFSKFAGILSVALSQHHLLGFEITHLEFHHLR